MAERPTLVLLHGVGRGSSEEAWRSGLDAALRAVGYPALDGVQLCVPRYPRTLQYPSDDRNWPLPPRTDRKLDTEAAKRRRWDLERQTAALEQRLGPHTAGIESGLLDPLAPAAQHQLTQVRRYLTDRDTRARVLDRVLNELPKDGRIVLVGHSLGSVIALDLLQFLPKELSVAGLVTIGSPAGRHSLHAESDRVKLKDPPHHVDWWVNVWHSNDVVVGGRGVSHLFPWALDLKIPRTAAHSSASYVRQAQVAEAIGYGLFGSLTKELELANALPDVQLDANEKLYLLGFGCGHMIRDHLRGETEERYGRALRSVQQNSTRALLERYGEEGRRVPKSLARLVDGDRPNAVVSFSKQDAIDPLISLGLGMQMIIQPYDIKISDEVRKGALRDLTVSMQLGGRFGENVYESLALAKRAVHPNSEWKRWALLGAGGAALLLGPVGLMLAAPAGLAGGAAIVSALATFGPGGMIGGLVTAGALTGTGAGTVAAALASSEGAVETLEAAVLQRLASAILLNKEGLPQDTSIWDGLCNLEREVIRERQRLSAYSDKDSPALKALERKHKAVQGALKHLVDKDLALGFAEDA